MRLPHRCGVLRVERLGLLSPFRREKRSSSHCLVKVSSLPTFLDSRYEVFGLSLTAYLGSSTSNYRVRDTNKQGESPPVFLSIPCDFTLKSPFRLSGTDRSLRFRESNRKTVVKTYLRPRRYCPQMSSQGASPRVIVFARL